MEEAVPAGLRDRPAKAGRIFAGRYLSITSFKRDGTAVSTPVWFVQQDGRLLVETDGESGKVKRIRHNPAVRVALCTASGRLRGELVMATAELLPESEVASVERLLMHKYRADMIVIRPLRLIQSALRLGRPRTKNVIIAITPDR